MGFRTGNKGGSADLTGEVNASTLATTKTNIGDGSDKNNVKLVVNGTASVEALKINTIVPTSSIENDILVLDHDGVSSGVVRVAKSDPRLWISSSSGAGTQTLVVTTGSFTDGFLPALTTSEGGIVDAVANSIVRQTPTLNKDSYYVGIGATPTEKLHIRATTAPDTPQFKKYPAMVAGVEPLNDLSINGTYNAGVERNYKIIMGTLAYQHDFGMVTGGLDWHTSGTYGNNEENPNRPAGYAAGNLKTDIDVMGLASIPSSDALNRQDILTGSAIEDEVYQIKIVHTSTIEPLQYSGTGPDDLAASTTWSPLNSANKVASSVGEDRVWLLTITTASEIVDYAAYNTPAKGVDHNETGPNLVSTTDKPKFMKVDTIFRVRIGYTGSITGSGPQPDPIALHNNSYGPTHNNPLPHNDAVFDADGLDIFTGDDDVTYRVEITTRGEISAASAGGGMGGTTTLTNRSAGTYDEYTGTGSTTHKIEISQAATSSGPATPSGHTINYSGTSGNGNNLVIPQAHSVPTGITTDKTYRVKCSKSGSHNAGAFEEPNFTGGGVNDLTLTSSLNDYTALHDQQFEVEVVTQFALGTAQPQAPGAGTLTVTNAGAATYTGTDKNYVVYQVEIESNGTPDRYRFRFAARDTQAAAEAALAGMSWNSGNNIVAGTQTLHANVEIEFGSTTGNTVGQSWYIQVPTDTIRSRKTSIIDGLGTPGAYSTQNMLESTTLTNGDSVKAFFATTRGHTALDKWMFTASVDRFQVDNGGGSFGSDTTGSGTGGTIDIADSIKVQMNKMHRHKDIDTWTFLGLTDRFKYSRNGTDFIAPFYRRVEDHMDPAGTAVIDGIKIQFSQPIDADVGDYWEIPITVDQFRRQSFAYNDTTSPIDLALVGAATEINHSEMQTVVSGVTVQFGRSQGHTVGNQWEAHINIDRWQWQAKDHPVVGSYTYNVADSSSVGVYHKTNAARNLILNQTCSFQKNYGHSDSAYWEWRANVERFDYNRKDKTLAGVIGGSTDITVSSVPVTGGAEFTLADGVKYTFADVFDSCYSHTVGDKWWLTASVDHFKYATSSAGTFDFSTNPETVISLVKQYIPSIPISEGGTNDITIKFDHSTHHTLNDVYAFTAAVDRYHWMAEPSGNADDGDADSMYISPISNEVAINRSNQLLDYGLNAIFARSTGHTQEDAWTFTASIAQPILAEDESGNKVFLLRNDGVARLYYNSTKFASFQVGDTGHLLIKATGSNQPQAVILSAPATQPANETLFTGSVTFYIDGTDLKVKFSKPDGSGVVDGTVTIT